MRMQSRSLWKRPQRKFEIDNRFLVFAELMVDHATRLANLGMFRSQLNGSVDQFFSPDQIGRIFVRHRPSQVIGNEWYLWHLFEC